MTPSTRACLRSSRLEAPSCARPRAAPGAVAAVISSRSSTRCRRQPTPSTPGASCQPVRVNLSRPDEVVRLAPARPHVFPHLDHRHPLVAAPLVLGRGTFRRLRHGCLQSLCACRAVRPRGLACHFVCATIESPDCGWRARREWGWVEVGRASRAFTKRPRAACLSSRLSP